MIVKRYEGNPILTKNDVPYQIEGVALITQADVHNVAFSCGATPEDDGSAKIYWAGAGTMMCIGTASWV